MYPPPPRFPASGNVTARANPVATAASMALPPSFMISAPTAAASPLLLATIAWGAKVAGDPALCPHVRGNVAGIRAGIAGACGDRSSGRAAPNPTHTAAATPEITLTLFTLAPKAITYRLIVCEPNPSRSATRSEGMLLVLLVPFARPLRSCMAQEHGPK